jgi:hypothetical protein
MGNRFASGKNSIAECDRCSFRFKLTELKKEVVKGNIIDLLVCPECWTPDQPQLMLGTFPIDDPQGIRDPRPDRSYQVSGLLEDGYSGGGSRVFQWGWSPVGGASYFDAALTPNNLALSILVSTVTVFVT